MVQEQLCVPPLVESPAAEPQAIIQISGLSVTYGTAEPTLRNVNLAVRQGEFVLITGASGCGKTTLARCLNGLIPHLIPARVDGTIQVAGLNPLQEDVRGMASHVGMVFQVPEAQLFNLTVEEEIAFGCHNLGLPAEETTRRVEFALGAVGLQAFRKRGLHQLSGGEKQLVSIASVLAMQPRIMVLDEPLSSVDTWGVQRVLGVLQRLNRTLGMTVLVIEHRTHQVAGAASRVIVMDCGQIVLDGPPELMQQERVYLSILGVRVPGAMASASPSQAAAPSIGETVVSLRDVSFAYHKRNVLQSVSLDLRRGEFLALVGDSGAGKSTLAHLIAGALKPASGSVRVIGCARGAQKVGLLLQSPSDQLFCDTVEEEVRFGPENFCLPVDEVVDEALECANLLGYRQREVQHLSRGQQQRLSLASVLALKPEVLILDEPTLGQDWGHLTRFMEFVKGLTRKGVTVLLITHDREVAAKYADRTVRLCDGQLVA